MSSSATKFKETEIGLIPEEWAFEPLKNHAEITMGQSPESIFYNNSGDGLVFLQGIRTFGEKYPTYDTYTTKITKKAKTGSVLLSVRAPVGEVNIATKDICIGRGLMAINSQNNEFIYQLFRAFKEYVVGKETGTVYGSVTRDDISHLKFPFPPIVEQKQIAEVLSSLDDKIELNRKINANLESLTSSLFKKWFVDIGDELPEGWTTELMTNHVIIDKGISYKGSDLTEDGKNVLVGLKCFERGGGFRVDGVKRYSGEFKQQHLLHAGDLIVAMTDLTQGAEVLGKPAVVPNIKNSEHAVASLDISILRPKTERISKAYLYLFFMRQETQDFLFGFSNGSTVLHLSIEGLKKIKIIVAPEKEMQKFNALVEPIFEKIQIINSEINNLAEVRDSLLPRLMNGKIRIKI